MKLGKNISIKHLLQTEVLICGLVRDNVAFIVRIHQFRVLHNSMQNIIPTPILMFNITQ